MTVEIRGKRHPARQPAPDSFYVEIERGCPKCRKKPCRVVGGPRRIETEDTYAADAYCGWCSQVIGIVRAHVETLFGLTEDEAITELAHARGMKVYEGS